MTSNDHQTENASHVVGGSIDSFIADHHARLVGLLILRTGDRDVAEDLAQEALFKLYRNWPQVSEMDHPWGWLAKVALNQSTSRWRSLRRFERMKARVGNQQPHHPDEAGLADLLTVIAQLPPRQRTALMLRHYAHFSVRETANHMSCAEGTVQSLTHQAIGRMKQLLKVEITDAND